MCVPRSHLLHERRVHASHSWRISRVSRSCVPRSHLLHERLVPDFKRRDHVLNLTELSTSCTSGSCLTSRGDSLMTTP